MRSTASRSRQPLATVWPLLAAALAAGCAQAPTQPPTLLAQPAAGQPHARLLVRATLPANHRWVVVVMGDNTACSGPQLVTRGPNALAATAPASPSAAPPTASPTTAARLPVGQLLTMDFAVVTPAAGTGKACINRWSFTPEAGKTYLVQGLVAGAQCPARLLDASVADQPRVPADLVSRILPGQNCVALDKSPKVPPLSLIQGGQHNGDAVLRPDATTRDLEGLIKP
jgi:hypothetical protein